MNVNEVIEKLTAKMEHNNGLAKLDAIDAIEVIKELADKIVQVKDFNELLRCKLVEEQEEVDHQKAEIERLSSENVSLKYDLQVASEESIEWKTQAIKEFAERLKEKSMTKFDWSDAVDVEDIDELVEEMTEE